MLFRQSLTKMFKRFSFFTHKSVENSVESVENIVKSYLKTKMKQMFLWKTFYIYLQGWVFLCFIFLSKIVE